MGTRATFVVGTATTRRFPAVSFDVTVAGLVLNAAPDEADEVAETIHVTTPRGVVAADVRDDLDGTEMMRAPSAATLDQGHRFPARFNPEAMATLFEGAGRGRRVDPALGPRLVRARRALRGWEARSGTRRGATTTASRR